MADSVNLGRDCASPGHHIVSSGSHPVQKDSEASVAKMRFSAMDCLSECLRVR